MPDVEGSSGENDSTKTAGVSLTGEQTDYSPDTGDLQETTNQEADPSPPGGGLGSGCIIESSDPVMEEAVPDPNLAPVEAEGSFSVPEVLQPTQLVTEAFESTVDTGGTGEDTTESKT